MQKSEARHPKLAPLPASRSCTFLDYWRVIRVRFGIVLLSFLLVVITAGITTYFQPRKYSRVRDAGIAHARDRRFPSLRA